MGENMPIYEYICSNCKQETEVLQKISAPALEQCPSCGQNALQKKISATAFKLTGDGWYVTDFKDKKSASNESNKASSKTDAKTES